MFAKLALLLGITIFLLIFGYIQINQVSAAEPRGSDSYMGAPEEPKQDDPGTRGTPGKPKDNAITQDYG